MASVSGYSADTLRIMSRETLRRVVNYTRREEFHRRLEQCRSSTRLETYVAELEHLAEDDAVCRNTTHKMARGAVLSVSR